VTVVVWRGAMDGWLHKSSPSGGGQAHQAPRKGSTLNVDD